MDILLLHTERPGALLQPCPTGIQTTWKQGLQSCHHCLTPVLFLSASASLSSSLSSPVVCFAFWLAGPDLVLSWCSGQWRLCQADTENPPAMGQYVRQGEREPGLKQQGKRQLKNCCHRDQQPLGFIFCFQMSIKYPRAAPGAEEEQ